MGAPKATETPAAAAADNTWKRSKVSTTSTELPNHPFLGLFGEQYLAALPFVLAVLGKQAAEEVSAATGHVDQRALLPQTETRRHSEDQSHRLNQQGPLPEVTPDDEAAQDGLDLWKTALLGLALQLGRKSPRRFSPRGFPSRKRTARTLAPATRPGRKRAEPRGCRGSSSGRTLPPPERGRPVSAATERLAILKGFFQKDLRVSRHQFGPLLPLRTLVPVVECGLVGRPAALLVAVPERRQTHALFQVGHPVHRQVDHSRQRACGRSEIHFHQDPPAVRRQRS